MKTIDVLGKPCPIPVIEAKKVLAEPTAERVLLKVDNIVAVQNLEKMANGYGYGFSFTEHAKDFYEVVIQKNGKDFPAPLPGKTAPNISSGNVSANGLSVVIGRNTMGEGKEELGKILIKGFIYSLTELPTAPAFVIFLNSGAYLTSEGANTIDDLKKLSDKGTTILTCGTCLNYYELQDKLAIGEVANMYTIAEKMALADKLINI